MHFYYTNDWDFWFPVITLVVTVGLGLVFALFTENLGNLSVRVKFLVLFILLAGLIAYFQVPIWNNVDDFVLKQRFDFIDSTHHVVLTKKNISDKGGFKDDIIFRINDNEITTIGEHTAVFTPVTNINPFVKNFSHQVVLSYWNIDGQSGHLRLWCKFRYEISPNTRNVRYCLRCDDWSEDIYAY